MILSNLDNIYIKSFLLLKKYCIKNQYKGYDPYDGLSSQFLNKFSHHKNTFFLILWIQFFKRVPFNFRKFFLIKKSFNPKSYALFLSGYCNLYKSDPNATYLNEISFFINRIKESISPGYSGACWGYNFDWASRAFYLEKNTPTIVVSSFIAHALLDAYEVIKDDELLEISTSTANFILHDLNRTTDNNKDICFSYSPKDHSVVYNASLLGASLLARLYHISGNVNLYNHAKSAVNFCCNKQNPDGSWSYGTLPHHSWIDNFHTGFNITSIAQYVKYTGDYYFNQHLKKAIDFYFDKFFTKEGKSKYYHNQLYPIDIHSVAQLIITLNYVDDTNKYKHLLNNVLTWTIKNMQSSKGFFYYQIHRYYTIRIPYMRWSQAWMFYAYTMYFKKYEVKLN